MLFDVFDGYKLLLKAILTQKINKNKTPQT